MRYTAVVELEGTPSGEILLKRSCPTNALRVGIDEPVNKCATISLINTAVRGIKAKNFLVVEVDHGSHVLLQPRRTRIERPSVALGFDSVGVILEQ